VSGIVRADLPGELASAEREVSVWEGFLADHPDNEGGKRLLTWARQHRERVRRDLRAAGLLEEE
jgi:hypothetical protein